MADANFMDMPTTSGQYGGFWDSLPKAPMDNLGGGILPAPTGGHYEGIDWNQHWVPDDPSQTLPKMPIMGSIGGPSAASMTGGQGQNVSVDQLKQIIGTDWSTGHLQQVLPQLQALGIEVQNQTRGDLRPRFRLPSGEVFDFGPGGWVPRGQMGPGLGDPTQAPSGTTASGLSGLGAGQAQSMADFFHNLPGYQFTLNEGLNALERGAAAKGTLLTGGERKGELQYATGLADTTMGNWIDRYLNASKLGLSATGAGT